MNGKFGCSTPYDDRVFPFSTCASGSWQCSKFACPRACTVMGNGHIDTFDGKTYTLIGSCQYTLLEVSLCHSNDLFSSGIFFREQMVFYRTNFV